MFELPVGPRQGAPQVVLTFRQGKDDGGVGLQRHVAGEPVIEDACDVGPLLRHARLLFHDRRQGYSLSR